MKIHNFTPKQLDEAIHELAEHRLRSLNAVDSVDLEDTKPLDQNPLVDAFMRNSTLVDAFMRNSTLAGPTSSTTLSPAAQALQKFISSERQFYLDQHDVYMEIVLELQEARKNIRNNSSLSAKSRSQLLQLLENHITGWKKIHDSLPDTSPEAHQVIHEQQLYEYQKQYEAGRIIRTPYVEDKIEELTGKLKLKGVVIVGGHTGLGKTEVARIVAEELTDKPPVLVSGFTDMKSSEMFGSPKLVKSGDEPHTIIDKVNEQLAKYQDLNPDASDYDLSAIRERVLRENNVTESEFVLKGVYQAIKENKVCILDEGNFIDPGLLTKLNDILTKKPGEYVDIQEDGGQRLLVTEPIRVIITGNFNQEGKKIYLNRREFDSAFVERAGYVQYDILPQETVGMMSDCEDPLLKQLFTVAMVPLMTERGGYIAPKGFNLESLFEFAKFAATSQLAFAGKLEGTHPLVPQKDSVGFSHQPSVQISNRRLISIIETWRDEGFIKPLDYYLYKDISNITNPTDRMLFYTMCQKSGFFQGDAWPSAEAFRDNFPLPPQILTDGVEVRPIEEMVKAIYGPGPVRTSWGENSDTAEGLEAIAKAESDLEALMEKIEEEMEIMKEQLPQVCPLD